MYIPNPGKGSGEYVVWSALNTQHVTTNVTACDDIAWRSTCDYFQRCSKHRNCTWTRLLYWNKKLSYCSEGADRTTLSGIALMPTDDGYSKPVNLRVVPTHLFRVQIAYFCYRMYRLVIIHFATDRQTDRRTDGGTDRRQYDDTAWAGRSDKSGANCEYCFVYSSRR